MSLSILNFIKFCFFFTNCKTKTHFCNRLLPCLGAILIFLDDSELTFLYLTKLYKNAVLVSIINDMGQKANYFQKKHGILVIVFS